MNLTQIYVDQKRADGHRFVFISDTDTKSIQKMMTAIIGQAQDPSNDLDYCGARGALDGIIEVRNLIRRRTGL